MYKRWGVILGLVLLAGVTWASTGNDVGYYAPPSWLSAPTMVANPNLGYGFSNHLTTPGRFDRNADGRIDLIIVDRNGDGRGDYWATDRDFDGLTDDYQYDRNFDGRVDQWEYDQDHDTMPEKIYIDGDGNGKSELYAELNPQTRTYTWHGNLSGVYASGGSGSAVGPAAGSGLAPQLPLRKKRMGRGKVGDSE